MKEIYTPAVLEICEFDAEDIITTSGAGEIEKVSLKDGGTGGIPDSISFNNLF